MVGGEMVGGEMVFFAESMAADGSAAAVNYKCTDYHFRSHLGHSSGGLTDVWAEDDEITIEFYNEPFEKGLVKDLV